MSRGVNSFTSAPGDWWTEHEYHTYVGNSNERNHQSMPMLTRHVPRQATLQDGNRDDHVWQLVEERVMMLPLRFAGYSLQPNPARQLVLDSGAGRGYPRGFMGQNYTPQGFTSQQNLPSSTVQEEGSRLSPDEQSMAVKKLKKEMYNPAPKTFTSRLSLYYRDRSVDSSKERRKETEDEGKRCAVCLEDFEAKEWVMVTPCSHMFHEECILPWVKSQGQCPVCRSALYERSRPNDLPDRDLLSVIRATEQVLRGSAVNW